MKVYVENITKKPYVDQYMKLLILHFLKKQIFYPLNLDLCKKTPNETLFLPVEVRVVLKRMTT